MTEYMEAVNAFINLCLLISCTLLLIYVVYLLQVRLPDHINKLTRAHLRGTISETERILKVVRKKEEITEDKDRKPFQAIKGDWDLSGADIQKIFRDCLCESCRNCKCQEK